jgi:hypothetical protein
MAGEHGKEWDFHSNNGIIVYMRRNNRCGYEDSHVTFSTLCEPPCIHISNLGHPFNQFILHILYQTFTVYLGCISVSGMNNSSPTSDGVLTGPQEEQFKTADRAI